MVRAFPVSVKVTIQVLQTLIQAAAKPIQVASIAHNRVIAG
jgi:hypothetical protein